MAAGAARLPNGSMAWTGCRQDHRRARRIEMGNLSSVKAVGTGVLEYRIDWGPGYRVYFGRDGQRLVILLAGGTKRRQQGDIRAAQERWADYKRRRKEEG